MNVGEILQLAGVLTGIGGLVGGVAALTRSRSEGAGTLSKAEAEFRRDLMARLDKAEVNARDAQALAVTASADANRCRADYQELLRMVEQCSTPGCAIRTARLRQQGGTP